VAMEYTDLSSRQLAVWITDNKDFAVSESTARNSVEAKPIWLQVRSVESGPA